MKLHLGVLLAAAVNVLAATPGGTYEDWKLGSHVRRSGRLEKVDAGEYEYLIKKRMLEDDGSSYASSSSSSSNNGGSSSSSSSSSSRAYGTNFFAESENTYYDGYQQAWRYLGHLVKCGYPSDRYWKHSHSHSNDQGNDYNGNNYCQRYLVWAAYVDLNYQGGGIGEYAIWDTNNNEWDYTACEKHGNGRCAPMDCHQSNTTTWSLMGVYKEAEYFGNDAFFEQLFKHEGYCIWNDEDLYDFMSEARENSWPQGCIQTYSYLTDSSGNEYGLYVDLKPTLNGNMTYGLYLDEICKTEYKGSAVTVDDVAATMGLLYGSSLDAWNDALEVYKVCQPCMAYNLAVDYQANNYGYYDGDYNGDSDNSGNSGNSGGSSWWKWGGNRKLGDDPNEGYFQCDDDADYTNVNQCMKFRSHADLEVASWEDLVIATEQGGILDINISGTIFGTEKMSYEEQLYKEELRKEKEAQEEAAYQALLRSIPSAVPMTLLGVALIVVGPLALAMVAFWAYNQRREGIDRPFLKEPLWSEAAEAGLGCTATEGVMA